MLGVEFEGNTLKKPLTENQIKSAAEFIIPKMIKYGWTINDITNHTTVNKQWDEYREQRIKETGDDRQSPKKDDVTQKNLDAVKKYIAEHYNEYFDK